MCTKSLDIWSFLNRLMTQTKVATTLITIDLGKFVIQNDQKMLSQQLFRNQIDNGHLFMHAVCKFDV